jgi:hypothetical protein
MKLIEGVKNALTGHGVFVELAVNAEGGPLFLLHSSDLTLAYRINLACVLANTRGAQWRLTAFFPPAKSLDSENSLRTNGDLRFKLELLSGASYFSLFQELKSAFFKPSYLFEMKILIQALKEAVNPNWELPQSLTKIGYAKL